MSSPPLSTILVVEDSPEDYVATERALQRSRVKLQIVHYADGDEALAWLRADSQQRSFLRLILLDLNLPGTDGRELLAEIKADPLLTMIPVVVLTTSSNPRDVRDCYRAGANTYIIKPVNLPAFYEAVGCVVRYWVEIAVLPES